MLSGMLNDRVALVKRDGTRHENVLANVQSRTIIIDDSKLPVEEGDHIERVLPNGLAERYVVLDRGYFAGHGSFSAHYQVKVEKTTAKSARADNKTVYNVSGANARININSHDASINVVDTGTAALFAALREAIISAAGDTANLSERVDALERSAGSKDYLGAYQQFISAAANHMTIIAPFLPALAQLASA